jgi:DNA-3-methyladenine glycosylase
MEDFNILNNEASVVGPRLLGCVLEMKQGSQILSGKIVETEAYDQNDVASHSYNGITPRTEVMFGEAGHLYVYFTYGMHYCCNIVVGEVGKGAAVLIRALEPISGQEEMSNNRHGLSGVNLTNGPAKLTQALMINKALNGHNLHDNPLRLIIRPELKRTDIVKSKRIGISKGKDKLWRFSIC